MSDLLDATVVPEMSAFSVQHRRAGVLLRMRARQSAPQRGMRLVLAIDRSSSMKGEKLEQARRAASILVEMLRDEDEIALVTFDATVSTVLSARPATRGGKAAAIIEISAVTAGRGTALCSAATTALGIAREARHGHVILLTDGYPFTGVTAPRAIERAVLEGCATATMSTVGYGDELDGPLLAAMATAAGGRFCHIDADGDPIAALGAELEMARGAATSRIQVTLRVANGAAITGIPYYATSTGTVLVARLPPATSEDDVTLGVELAIPRGLAPGVHAIGLACIEVGHPGAALDQRIELPIEVRIAESPGPLDRGVTRALCHVLAANALHAAALGEREPAELVRRISDTLGWIRARATLAGIDPQRELSTIVAALTTARRLLESDAAEAPRMAAAAEGISKGYDASVGTSPGDRGMHIDLADYRTSLQALGAYTATGFSLPKRR